MDVPMKKLMNGAENIVVEMCITLLSITIEE